MSVLAKFEKFNRKVSAGIEWVGLCAITVMMLITTVDVLGSKLFKMPVFGALDIMMLAQLIAVSFAIAMALILGRHVQVEFFVILLPKRLQHVVDCAVKFLGLCLFVLIVWRLFVLGYDLQSGGEESATARIPIFPFAYAAALACIPVCLIYLQQLLTSILRAVKNES